MGGAVTLSRGDLGPGGVGRVGGLGIQRLTSRICFGGYFAGALHLLLHEIMRNHGNGAIEMNIAAHIVAPILVFRAVLKG